MKTILAMGQSNAVGVGTGGLFDFPASVTVWNSTPELTSATTGLGTAFVAPVRGSPPFISDHNNMMIHACRYLQAETGESIRLVLVAKAGFAISNWHMAGGIMYARMQAILAAAGVTKVDAFLWHQGEADFANYATYQSAWNTLVGRLTSDGYIDATTPIVVGELAVQSASTTMNAVLRTIADASPIVGLAGISCFPVNSAADMHFTGPGLVRAGLEYARETMKLPGPFWSDVDEPDPLPYVTGIGYSQYSVPTGYAAAKILVKAENGCRDWIDAGGFICKRTGVYEFQGSGYAGTGLYGVDLINQNDEVLQYLTSSDAGGAQHYDGSTVMACGLGDRVYLGAHQASGAAGPTIDALTSARFNRLTVKYLGRN